MNQVAIVIPARYGSTRFEGKPLVRICGRPMIQLVYEKATMVKRADIVVVATDDERILETVKGFHGNAVMTSPFHKTGSDRIIEVAKDLDCRWIINLQGDEPMIEPEVIDLLAQKMLEAPEERGWSLMRPLSEISEFTNPNVVKVVTDHMDYALYFSRAPIPCPKTGISQIPNSSKTCDKNLISTENVWIHVGIYGYRNDFLLSIPDLKPSLLEKIEGLEQLRILANGYKIKMIRTKYRSIGVDTPEDLRLVERLMRQKQEST